MRLREAMILALRHDACLAKSDRSTRLRIVDLCFVPVECRAKYGSPLEVKLSARDCLSEDWVVEKNGKTWTELC